MLVVALVEMYRDCNRPVDSRRSASVPYFADRGGRDATRMFETLLGNLDGSTQVALELQPLFHYSIELVGMIETPLGSCANCSTRVETAPSAERRCRRVDPAGSIMFHTSLQIT